MSFKRSEKEKTIEKIMKEVVLLLLTSKIDKRDDEFYSLKKKYKKETILHASKQITDVEYIRGLVLIRGALQRFQ